MTPVNQSKLYAADGTHNGNCFAACLASVLEVPLWMVPPFDEMFARTGEDYMFRVDEWLKRFFRLRKVRTSGHHIDELPEFYIANGNSSRGVQHSVVYSGGALAHDPHPSKEGIKNVLWTWHFEPIEEADGHR